LAFRAGLEDRPSAVPKAHPNAFIPLNAGKLYSLGFSYSMEDEKTVDFAVGYFFTKKFYAACTAQLGNGCDPYNVVFGPYQGEDITTKVKFLLFELMYSKHF